MGQIGEQDSNDSASDLQSKHDSSIQNEESKKKHKCHYPDCQAVFLRPSRLERHIRSHTGEVTITSIRMILLCNICLVINDSVQ